MATAATLQFPTEHDFPFEGDLDDLRALSEAELAELYADAHVPEIADLRGDMRGRMLEVVPIPELARGPLRAWASSSFFPWRGKSFRPLADTVGRGINRVVSDRLQLYPFLTTVKPSRAGDFDAVELDYDLPENPFFIRDIKDEIRTVRDGLYLGQAYLCVGDAEHLAVYFALQRAPTR